MSQSAIYQKKLSALNSFDPQWLGTSLLKWIDIQNELQSTIPWMRFQGITDMLNP
jgi:hypothetical protein